MSTTKEEFALEPLEPNRQESDQAIEESSDQEKPSKEATKWYSVDRSMLTSKATYFFQNAKQACYTPHMMIFLTSIGLDPAKAGMVNGLRYTGYILGPPLWGLLADRTHAHRRIIFLICVLAIIFNCAQPFVTITYGDKTKNRCPEVKNVSSLHEVDQMDGDTNTLFYVMLFMNIVTVFFDGSTVAFADAGVMQRINTSTKKHDFGRQRFFGAVGFGSGALLSSAAIELFPAAKVTCYSAVFIVYFILVSGLAVSTNLLFKGLEFTNEKERKENQNLRLLLWDTLKQFHVWVFFFTILFVGTARGLYLSFLFLFLKEELDSSNLIMGFAIATGSVSSICIFGLSGKIIKLVGGTLHAMLLGCASWAVRYLFYSYFYNPWTVLPIQLLQGFGFGLFVSAYVQHVKLISKPAIWATMYGITNSLFFGCGLIVANLVGGVGYKNVGGRKLFLSEAIASSVWCVLLAFYIFLQRFKWKSTSEKDVILPTGGVVM
ncbi:major facilitator superfamily domain-containing protein 6-A-like [Hydractinia symbiolongicarpus]|uniref:major facilitator superfamily domain-containing protein 6-A-like n=1 Tax=Hydractinia symbiolongicarpus TaxID=13093 RepID=UPI0025504551|nr:major facilitator superfamily domain-containing protein 6-A-like [Hydractinia symbiolongicarpus]